MTKNNLFFPFLIAFVFALFIACGCDAQTGVRTWTSVSGKTYDREFVEIDGDQVVWKDADGKRTRIKLEKLSPKDQKLAQKLQAKADDANDKNKAAAGNESTSDSPAVITLEGHTRIVKSASFSPDGKRVVTGSWDNTARVWDAATGKELAKLEGHTDIVQFASFSPDGKRVVTGSADGDACVWDAATGKELVKLEGHTGAVESASFSPDGTRVITGSFDKTARVGDAATGKELVKLEHTEDVLSASFSLTACG